MTPPDLDTIRNVFAGSQPALTPVPQQGTSAAVAIVFRPAPTRPASQPASAVSDLELCFVRRAPFPGDPWSGDMAFPGGKGERTDRNYHEIAARESLEEIGLELSEDDLIGGLPDFDVQPLSRKRQMRLKPMIYFQQETPDGFQLSEEIADAYWIPVGHLWDPQQLTTVDWGRLAQDYPGIRHQSYVIWGLTYRILGDLAAHLRRPLPRA